MPDVVDLLERLGSESIFHVGDAAALVDAVTDTALDAPLQAALVAGDPARVRTLLGQPPMVAVIMPAEEEEEGDEEQEDTPAPAAPSSRGEPTPAG